MSTEPAYKIDVTEDPASSISILCNEARYYSPFLADAILEVFKIERKKEYRLAVKYVDWYDPIMIKRISEVVSYCEEEVKEEYDEFIRILKKVKNDPAMIHKYFYRLEDLYVQNIRVAEIGYIIGTNDSIK